jgi:hypothetical protein
LRFDAHKDVEGARSSPCPAAVPLPLVLTGNIAVDDDSHSMPALRQAVDACKKVVYLGSNTVWLLHQMSDVDDKVCMTATTTLEDLEALTASGPDDSTDTDADVRLEPVEAEDLPDGVLSDHIH